MFDDVRVPELSSIDILPRKVEVDGNRPAVQIRRPGCPGVCRRAYAYSAVLGNTASCERPSRRSLQIVEASVAASRLGRSIHPLRFAKWTNCAPRFKAAVIRLRTSLSDPFANGG